MAAGGFNTPTPEAITFRMPCSSFAGTNGAQSIYLYNAQHFVADGILLISGTSPGITITGGNVVHPVMGGFNVPKRDLVFSLVALFQAGLLKIPALSPETNTLVNELMNFKMKIKTDTAHDSYEAWREGDHDDLVLSASLRCWFINYRYNTKKPRKVARQHGW